MKGKGNSRRTFKKGDQCVQNPSTRRHRDDVKKNVISQRKSKGGLTLAALQKHNEDIEEDLHMEDLAISETTATTKKSKALSISGLTDCSNMTFNRVMDKWKSTDSLDQEKCAVLAAVTEVIRSRGGSESETDYFAALMTLLESTTEEGSCTAVLYLLSLVIKKVPTTVLRTKCAESLKCFTVIMEAHHENGRASLLMGLLDCLATTLNAQDPAIWTEHSTQRSFQMMLMFIIHSKPKVRKVAHNSIQSILKLGLLNHKNHPSGSLTAKHLIQIFQQNSSDTATMCHHSLNFLKNCLHYFGEKQLKELCEAILQLLSTNNPIMKTNSMQTLHSMFKSNPPEENLSADLNCKLILALYDFQPSFNDVHVAEAWLAVQLEAHSNLSLLDNKLCLKHLTKFFGTALNFFQSDHMDVVKAAANYMKEASEKCMESYIDILEEDVTSNSSSFLKILKIMESGLTYKFQPVWNIVLQSLQYLYATYGRLFPNQMVYSVANVIQMYSGPAAPFFNNLKKTIGAAFTSMGPKLILNDTPLELMIKDSSDCQFPRAWLLPIMKDSIKQTELQYFIDEFLPVAAHLKRRGEECRKNKEDLEAKVYETLLSQVWSLLTGFCHKPTDVSTAFKNIAKVMGSALTDQKNLRQLVIQALRNLISTAEEESTKFIGQFAKNYLPILFNLYTSDDEDCKGISLHVLEGIRSFLIVADEKLVLMFLDKSLEKLDSEKSSLKKHQLMDLIVSMVKYCDDNHLNKLFKLMLTHIDRKCWKQILKAARKKQISVRFDEIKALLADSLSSAKPSSKAPRLRCLSCLVKRLTRDQKDFLQAIIPEVILCTKEIGVKAKTAAFELIVDIGTALVFLSDKPKEECIEEYFTLVMAGLAGSPHMISGTLLAFTKMVFEYRYCLAEKLIGSLLEAAILLLKHKSSDVVKASLIFVRALVKILDASELTGHLGTMINNLFAWSATSKSAHRQQIRIILERLDKKCGYATIRPLVPEEHRKFIVQIHKQMERNKRKKDDRKNADEGDDVIEQKENTWEDILAESADEEEESVHKRPNKQRGGDKKDKKSSSGTKTWIMEGDETVDLMDPKIAQNIVGTRPKLHARKRGGASAGFEMSSDGKFMIDNKTNDQTNNEDDITEKPLDIGQQDMLAGFDKTPKQLKAGKRKMLEDMPESEGGKFEYQPGGRGIHRDRDMDDDDQPAPKRRFGGEYKAKKAGGDMKLKGKPDPYAYIPLDRQKLNKRKRAKLTGQFNSMVKATKRGAAKSKQQKKHKK
ncbi:RRP12-like protein [Clytia hemisphaerica]|uniref:RRP12-like protein n=1 Tax=Clytia hemisphaerica TaxID=252671 RepID=UPI0034D5A7AA